MVPRTVQLTTETPERTPLALEVKTVLVVDDSSAQRLLLAALLGRWGYRVLQASSGAEALELAHTHNVELVISDWVMPGMSGLDFCREFKASSRRGFGYFLLLTSKSDKIDVAMGLEVGADDFLTKPVNSGELRARLIAGERIIGMQRELRINNELLSDTLDRLRAAHASLDRDLVEARSFQQSLMPERFRAFDGGQISLLLRPSGHVGGDFVGSFRVSETRIGLFCIDVSGHGIASGLLAARIAGYLSGSSPAQNIAMTIDDLGLYTMLPPEEVCARLNDLMLAEMETDLYLTMVVADCNLKTGRLRVAQAGHPPPLVQREDGSTQFIGDGGLPVGLIPGATYSGFDLDLGPGDRFLAYSDGMTESADPSGTELGEAGLASLVRDAAGLSGPDFLEALSWGVDRFAGTEVPADDISGILLEFRPSTSAQ